VLRVVSGSCQPPGTHLNQRWLVVRRWPDGVSRQGANLPDQSLSGACVQFFPKGGHRRAANSIANDAVKVGVADL